MNKSVFLASLFVALTSFCAAQASTEPDKSQQQEAAAIPPAPQSYMGREIAITMHYTGAPWLVRESREREEGTKLLLDQLDIEPGMTICDMGCGNGFYTIPMAEQTGKTGRIYAVDIQQEMLDLLQDVAQEAELSNIEGVLGTVIDPKLPDASIDLMIVVDVYHEMSHPQQMLAAIRKSLKPDGRLVLVEFRAEDPKLPIKKLHKMSKVQVLKELIANGFKLTSEFNELPRQHMQTFQIDPDWDRVNSVERASPGRPNVIVLITDDQGYGDLAAHGNTIISTPNLDRLAAESVRFTDFHVDPTCSPTRSALMSGRYSTRTGVWHTIMGRSLMAPEEVTLAEVFLDNGYRTGMFGKWHLGDNWPLRPQDQGFEHVVWHHGGGVGQGPDYWGNDYFDDSYEVNGHWRNFDGYCTDVWFREAMRFIEQDDDRPFFAYISTNAPHGPFLVDEAYSNPYRELGVADTMAQFYGMITNIDDNVGRLRAALEESGLAENTIFIFMTDNGTAAGHAPRKNEAATWSGFNAGMRGHKGSEYDGGHRVPFFVSWPASSVGGGKYVQSLAAHIDVMPTLIELCGLETRVEAALDGASFAEAIRGTGPPPTDRTLFVHSQRIDVPVKWRKSAVMMDRWRLINGTELYDMDADPGQLHDIAAAHPEFVAKLRSRYDAWWESLEPAFDGYVRIGLGGDEDPVNLMSHDWHTQNQGVPWHQNHIRNGYVANGPWVVEVARAGEYEVVLRRWPEQLDRAMDVVHASVEIGGASAETDLPLDATSARFRLRLPAGPAEFLTTLRREDGTVHGAYFASVRFVTE